MHTLFRFDGRLSATGAVILFFLGKTASSAKLLNLSKVSTFSPSYKAPTFAASTILHTHDFCLLPPHVPPPSFAPLGHDGACRPSTACTTHPRRVPPARRAALPAGAANRPDSANRGAHTGQPPKGLVAANHGFSTSHPAKRRRAMARCPHADASCHRANRPTRDGARPV